VSGCVQAECGMVLINKWTTFGSGVLLEMVAGLQYSFSVYSESMKASHHLTQGQVQFIGTVTNAGNYVFGMLSGATYDLLAVTRPNLAPRITCSIGLVLCSVGYPLLWAVITKRIYVSDDADTMTAVLAFLAFLAALAGPFCDGTAMTVSVQNFPRHRGQVVGQLKSFVGLATSLHLAVYSATKHTDSSDFILLQVVSASSACLLGMICQNVVPIGRSGESENDDSAANRKLRITFIWGAVIAAAVAGISLMPVSTPRYVHVYAASGLMATLVAMLLWTALSSGPVLLKGPDPDLQEPLLGPHPEGCGDSPTTADGEARTEEEDLDIRVHQIMAEDEVDAAAAGRHAEEKLQLMEVEPQVSLAGALMSPTYWLLYAIVMIGTGAGLTFNNNLAQIVLSFGGEPGSQIVFVALYSVSSCVARSLFGELSQQALLHRGTPRTAFLVLSTALTTIASLVAASGSLPLMYLASVAGGFAFGSYWLLMPAIVSEIFGTRFFATIYSFTSSSPALGSFLLSELLASALYGSRGIAHGDPPDTCMGTDCFRPTFVAIAAMGAAALLMSLAILTRTTPRYKVLHRWLSSPDGGEQDHS